MRTTIKFLRRLRKEDKGAVLIEFALVTPVLLVLLVGLTDFAMFQNERMRLNAAARAGAQYALADDSDMAAIEAVVQSATGLDPNLLTITIEKTYKCSEEDDEDDDPSNDVEHDAENDDHECEEERSSYISITVSEEYSTFLDYPWLDNPYLLVGEAVMRTS